MKEANLVGGDCLELGINKVKVNIQYCPFTVCFSLVPAPKKATLSQIVQDNGMNIILSKLIMLAMKS